MKRFRNDFGSDLTKFNSSRSSLVSIQRESYEAFLCSKSKNDSCCISIGGVFKTVFPFEDSFGNARVEFVSYRLGEPKYNVEECRVKSLTYGADLYATIALVLFSIDQNTGVAEVKSIKEQEVLMCQVPLMTDNATFVINGFERVVISQIHRSPGVFFTRNMSDSVPTYSASIIPYRGSWIVLSFDSKSSLYFRVDKKKKLPIYYLLSAFGMNVEEMIKYYYRSMLLKFDQEKNKWLLDLKPEEMVGKSVPFTVKDGKGVIICNKDGVVTRGIARSIKEAGDTCYCDKDDVIGLILAEPVFSNDSLIYDFAHQISSSTIDGLIGNKLFQINVIDSSVKSYSPAVINSVLANKDLDQLKVLSILSKVMFPGELFSQDAAEEKFRRIFCSSIMYDLFPVGRYKINTILGIDVPSDVTVLRPEDVFLIVKRLTELKEGSEVADDIDDLRNRRIRSVGELMENQFRIGLNRVVRSIKEKLHSGSLDQVVPDNLINGSALARAMKDFFVTSQLSQFMDQTNPLAELSHKRRISSLGAGGLTRDRAGIEVRDVHPTHYGRICPIETPEGQNIGLISSLATYSIVNKYGFIEAPYRKVIDKVIQKDVVYLDAMTESKSCICQFDNSIVSGSTIVKDVVGARRDGEFVMVRSSEVDYIDVSPRQTISVATSLIPFLENDDAKRALMGSNMQRQAVPLLFTEAPLIGTGTEFVVAMESNSVVLSKRAGVVDYVDAQKISIRVFNEDGSKSSEIDSYNLRKFERSNNSTCINQIPTVSVGQVIQVGESIADGPATSNSEIALGKNLLVAIMPWNGYNFEDSIIISERVVKNDEFVSVHIKEFEVVVRDTRLGVEEITRDIPNVSGENLSYLDESGVVHLGAFVKPNDLLVGKLTPRSESPITPEERLLRAIFGERVADVRDSSLRVPPGVAGTIVDVSVLTRRGLEKSQRAQYIVEQQVAKLHTDYNRELEAMTSFFADVVLNTVLDKEVSVKIEGKSVKKTMTQQVAKELKSSHILHAIPTDSKLSGKVSKIVAEYKNASSAALIKHKKQIEKAMDGDELPPGVLQIIRVYIAVKSKLQTGDKMAGRHGNKGVVSKVLPIEDMPYMEDGEPVDIILNPFGVPARMNIGQILETNLGWASRAIGKRLNDMVQQKRTEKEVKDFLLSVITDNSVRDIITKADNEELKNIADSCKKGFPFATPAFEAIKVPEIEELFEKVGLDKSGQVTLYDGLTGEPFDRKITVGYMYIMKLHHLVNDKIHARSTGTYSLVTQQPLGGKSNFGGQRLGEMECWALQSYGAAYTLKEMLTVKSDDVQGRNGVYESIVKGEAKSVSHIPESFNVLFKELRALGFNVRLNSYED
ncbi:MAG: DNA-directed RNA polymerase subunit beta [Alphaproteobacteria bacterium]|nr:DNA-directed RNA polymerase subunit beta [Rickettsiales bacterium]